jgi:hypothetical protein
MTRRRHYAGFRKPSRPARKRSEKRPPADLTLPELLVYAVEVIERDAMVLHIEYCVASATLDHVMLRKPKWPIGI